MFSPTVLAQAKLEDIKQLLSMPYWQDEKYKKILNPTILANSKSVVKKLPILFDMIEKFELGNFVNSSFFLKSPSQAYALLMHMSDNDIPFVIDGKLSPLFSSQPGRLKKLYNIDINQLIEKYPIENYLKEGSFKI